MPKSATEILGLTATVVVEVVAVRVTLIDDDDTINQQQVLHPNLDLRAY